MHCQTEREDLAIVWECGHLHLYLFGEKFNLVSDCRPLEVVFNTANLTPKARVESWRLRLQKLSKLKGIRKHHLLKC